MHANTQNIYQYVIQFAISLAAAIVIFIVGKIIAKFATQFIESALLKAGVDKTLSSFSKPPQTLTLQRHI